MDAAFQQRYISLEGLVQNVIARNILRYLCGSSKRGNSQMEIKKKALVDVPVQTNIWIRPECQKKQFEVIKKARPSILFVMSDGGRNEEEWEIIRQNRLMYDTEIDWECTVYRMYEDTNNGMYGMGRKIAQFIWSKVDRCVLLEDEVIPSISFFSYCAELLERYKDDERISCICGLNHLEVSDQVTSDYFFSRQGSIWGIATWKRVWDRFYDFEYGKDPYVMGLLKERLKHNKKRWKPFAAYAKSESYAGHVASAEFFLDFAVYGQNQLQIIPRKNLISNVGCDETGVHSGQMKVLPHGLRRVFHMPVYELDFPLKHAKYVIPDMAYERKRERIMASGHPIVRAYRQFEQLILLIRYGEFKRLMFMLRNKLPGIHEK